MGGGSVAAVGWQHRQGIYDTRTQLNYMRLTPDNRILFGGRLGYFFGDDTDRLCNIIKQHSPAQGIDVMVGNRTLSLRMG